MAQYLDEDGDPVGAGSDVNPPKGYSLLTSKKRPSASNKKASVKELKILAAAKKPIVPPKGYIPEASVSAYTPSFFEQARSAVANSAIGYSLEQALPSVATALHLHPTEKMGTPQAEQHKNQLLSPEYLAPALTEAIRTGPLMQAPAPKEGRAPDATSNRIEGALRASGGLTTPGNMSLMAVTGAAGAGIGEISPAVANVLGRMASGGFTLQMLKGLYDQHKEYRKAVDAGNINEAQKIQGEMGVTGIMALLSGKHALTNHPFTPVTEPPVRERTNVLHRNTAGEVRQAKGQVPTVWLNSDAMNSLLKQMYPDENSAGANGFSIPKRVLESHANDTQFAHPEIKELLTKAHENAGEGGAAFAVKRDSIQQNVNVIREELNHTWQRNLAENGNFENHLKPGVFSDLRRDIPQGMYDHLAKNGYDEHDSPQMVSEAAAKLMGGNYEKFGTNEEDAAEFLNKYFTDVTAQHGSEALNSLKHVKGIARQVKEKVNAEHAGKANAMGPDGGLGDGRADRENLQGMAGGGEGGTSESSEGTEQSGKGEKPLFNREQEKPTWYLKSERLIGDKMKGPQAAEDVHKMLISGGVKPEEMQWTGLDDFLKSKGKDKVTPEEIREHLANNNIQIQEVAKGGAKPVEWKTYPNGVLYTPEGYKIERISGNGMYRLTDPSGMISAYDTADEAKDQVDKYRGNTREDTVPTKYAQYQLPGGDNYREMLLTMGDKVSPEKRALESYRDELRKKYGIPIISDEAAKQFTPEERAKEQGLFDAVDHTQDAPQRFKSSHWDEPNILAHIRFNDRTGPNGEKLLHIEEAQSDLHQLGRRKGYQDKASLDKAQENFNSAKASMEEAHKKAREYDAEWSAPGKSVSERTEARLKYQEANEKAAALREKMYEAQDVLDGAKKGVIDAPWKKNWHEQALRRMLKYAADNNYSGMSWTPGIDQNARYSLSTVADKLRYDENHEQLEVFKDGSLVKRIDATPDKLPDIVGKEVAQRLMDQPAGEKENTAPRGDLMVESDFNDNHFVTNVRTGEELGKYATLEEANEAMRSGKFTPKNAGVRELEGKDLEVGGSGMKGFYDKIVPDYLNKFGKKFGAKVDSTKISVKDSYDNVDWKPEDARVLHRGDQYQVWAPNKNGYDQFQKDFSTQEEADNYIKKHAEGRGQTKDVQYLPITPEMRKSVAEEGVPLFNREKFEPAAPDQNTPSDDGYLYHATNHYRASDIANEGLLTHDASAYTDQEAWSDGSEEKRNYFTPKASSAHSFQPEDGQGVLLRVKRDDRFRDEKGTGDVYSNSAIPSKDLEILGKDGKWIPVTQAYPKNDATSDEKPEGDSTSLEANTIMKGDAENPPEQPTGEEVAPPEVSTTIPIQGGTTLASAPKQNRPDEKVHTTARHQTTTNVSVPLQTAMDITPVVTKRILPLSQVMAMAAAQNPSHQIGNVRDLMKESKRRDPTKIVP